ncbi:hypothetical protein JWG45_21465 [Leptospira sp. 201903070]|uniref:Uncharacterized protein n=1 Tax=Leptospira ainlahdjerensis TaxID=2810033 RepID=A0ABS2UJI0_9LEPT|nr:hypothetical protein [Leptospira ainlahdjerensis]MBM9579722.1 hypothetical protein [Leptospira ainlahdjerensis]
MKKTQNKTILGGAEGVDKTAKGRFDFLSLILKTSREPDGKVFESLP